MSPITIGRMYGWFSQATYDDLRIFGRALLAEEVEQLVLSNRIGSHTVTRLQFTGANNMV